MLAKITFKLVTHRAQRLHLHSWRISATLARGVMCLEAKADLPGWRVSACIDAKNSKTFEKVK